MKQKCQNCNGTGRPVTLKKVYDSRRPWIKQGFDIHNCKVCKGKGWIDPHD